MSHKIDTSKKVALVGFAEGRQNAPFNDPEFEIWGVNEIYLAIPRVDVLFELHGYEFLKTKKDRNATHLQWLREAKIPIYMQKHFKDIPASIEFPKAELIENYGEYFTNTISWEIALALYLGYKELYLYGVNMATDIEYKSQRPSVEYFIGLARGMGVKVIVPPESDLLKSWYLYGFEDEHESVMSQRLTAYESEIDKRMNVHKQIAEQNLVEYHFVRGVKAGIDYMRKSFIYPSSTQGETNVPNIR